MCPKLNLALASPPFCPSQSCSGFFYSLCQWSSGFFFFLLNLLWKESCYTCKRWKPSFLHGKEIIVMAVTLLSYMPANQLTVFVFIYLPLRNLNRSYNLVHSKDPSNYKRRHFPGIKVNQGFSSKHQCWQCSLTWQKLLTPRGNILWSGRDEWKVGFYNSKEGPWPETVASSDCKSECGKNKPIWS